MEVKSEKEQQISNRRRSTFLPNLKNIQIKKNINPKKAESFFNRNCNFNSSNLFKSKRMSQNISVFKSERNIKEGRSKIGEYNDFKRLKDLSADQRELKPIDELIIASENDTTPENKETTKSTLQRKLWDIFPKFDILPSKKMFQKFFNPKCPDIYSNCNKKDFQDKILQTTDFSPKKDLIFKTSLHQRKKQFDNIIYKKYSSNNHRFSKMGPMFSPKNQNSFKFSNKPRGASLKRSTPKKKLIMFKKPAKVKNTNDKESKEKIETKLLKVKYSTLLVGKKRVNFQKDLSSKLNTKDNPQKKFPHKSSFSETGWKLVFRFFSFSYNVF